MSQSNQSPHQAPPATPAVPPTGWPAGPPLPGEPTFQVRAVKHTGAVVVWVNQARTTTGTYAQCAAAIAAAQRHCMLFGWWSIGSLLWNPISLARNAGARRTLRRQAQHAHDYAQWWSTHYGGAPNRLPPVLASSTSGPHPMAKGNR